MREIIISLNKTLKLSNCVYLEINEQFDLGVEQGSELMNNFIRNKGRRPIGPIIQYYNFPDDNKENGNLDLKLMRQSDGNIYKIEAPFKFRTLIKVKNCLYSRFIGQENNIKIAIYKMKVMAYEQEIKLKGNCYIIFVNQNEDYITADIFMERADNE